LKGSGTSFLFFLITLKTFLSLATFRNTHIKPNAKKMKGKGLIEYVDDKAITKSTKKQQQSQINFRSPYSQFFA